MSDVLGRSQCHSCGQRMPISTPQPNPSIRHLLRNNSTVYPNSQIHKPIVRQEKAVILELDKEINHYLGILDSLKLTRDAHAQALAERESIMAPIRRLPVELLTLIMMESLPNIKSWELSSYNQVVSLSQVSFAWRMITSSNPTLWQRILITHRTTADHCLWILKQASNVPLFIDVKCVVQGNITTPGLGLELAINHSERWKSLSFDFLPNDIKPIFNRLGDCLPILESLDLGQLMRRDTISLGEGTPFRNAPLMKELAVFYPLQPKNLAVPWHQLSTVHFFHPPVAVAVAILQQCPLLEIFHGYEIYNILSDGAKRVIAKQLKQLVVNWADDYTHNNDGFAPLVNLPLLTTAAFSMPHWWRTEGITSMLLRSSCELTTMTLRSPNTSLLELRDLVLALPKLHKLNLHFTFTTHEMLVPWMKMMASIAEDGAPRRLCKLQQLRVFMHGFCPNESDTEAIASVVHRRYTRTAASTSQGGAIPPSRLSIGMSFDCILRNLDLPALEALMMTLHDIHLYSIVGSHIRNNPTKFFDSMIGRPTLVQCQAAYGTWGEILSY